jgi:RecJ-like exonuclease
VNQEKKTRKGNGFSRNKGGKKRSYDEPAMKEARREKICPECNGEGYLENTYEICEYCGGSGKITF